MAIVCYDHANNKCRLRLSFMYKLAFNKINNNSYMNHSETKTKTKYYCK